MAFDGTSFQIYSRACLLAHCKLIMFAQINIRRFARLKCSIPNALWKLHAVYRYYDFSIYLSIFGANDSTA